MPWHLPTLQWIGDNFSGDRYGYVPQASLEFVPQAGLELDSILPQPPVRWALVLQS